MNDIGTKIKKYRKEKGLTQKELGKLLNVSGAMIAQYEKGIRKPKIETLDKIASALGVKIADITKSYTWAEYQRTDECKRMEKEVEIKSNAQQGIVNILIDIYGYAEEKSVCGKYGEHFYYLVGKADKQFILEDYVIKALYESVKASIPHLINCMKINQTEDEYIKECLEELSSPELLERIQEFERKHDNQDQEN